MATEAQILANRLNAGKSTGPRTAEGKEIVSQNAVKHGLLARRAVIVGEDPWEFEFHRDRMLAELAPAGAMESMLAERVVSLSWRLRRAERVQNEAFDALITKDTDSPLARLTQSLRPRGDFDAGEDDSGLGRVVVKDFGHARVLDRLLMYERRIENSLYKTMTELQRLRLMRDLEPAMEKPTRQGKCWGKPQPTTATEKTTSEPACPGGDDLLRQTKPISESQYGGKPRPATQSPAPRETTPGYAKQTQFAAPVSREPGADCAKQSQSAAPRTKANSCLRSGLRQERRMMPPQKQSQFTGLESPRRSTFHGRGGQ